jgi:imidazolonepropionase
MPADFVIRGAAPLITCRGPVPRRGPDQHVTDPIADGTVAAYRGRIVFVGSTSEWDRSGQLADGAITLDATGHAVLPGFIDPHTHLVFAGDRRDELSRRLAGATYAENAARGGGILGTVRATREASEDALVTGAHARLRLMLEAGTTTCEAKSGYGLTTDVELRMLRAVRRLNLEQPIEIVATFLGAHEIPEEYRERRAAYVALVSEEMIPAVAREQLAAWCDVFCEKGVFTPGESTEILLTARSAGLGARVHADELASSGGALVAVEVGARSADHLVHVTREHAELMAQAGVVATLLPTAAFYLKLGRYAPARMLIDTGVPVALATDLNPGGGFSPSMPFAMALACFAMNMTLEEAIVASTINAAYALDRHALVGSLEIGKQLDAVIVRGDLGNLLHVGAPAIAAVVKKGRIVVADNRALAGSAPVRAESTPTPTP